VARPSWSGRFPVFLDRLVNGVNDLREGKVAGRAVVLL
jgi:hypothetical protein